MLLLFFYREMRSRAVTTWIKKGSSVASTLSKVEVLKLERLWQTAMCKSSSMPERKCQTPNIFFLCVACSKRYKHFYNKAILISTINLTCICFDIWLYMYMLGMVSYRAKEETYSPRYEVCVIISIGHLPQHQVAMVNWCWKNGSFIVNHVQNIHEHDGQLYTECTHGPLEGRERQKKWLISGKLPNIYSTGL